MSNRNVIALTIALSFAMTAPAITVLLGGVVGSILAPNPKWSTLPVALMVIGGATTSFPAAHLMRLMGRKFGFILAAFIGIAAGLLAAYAVHRGVFTLFCVASLLTGVQTAFVQQYRFAAAESVPLNKASNAISFMMLGGIVAAYLGPEVATLLTKQFGEQLYVGSFIGLSLLMSGAMTALLFYQNTASHCSLDENPAPARKTGLIITQPLFITAITASATGVGVMGFIMTVTPLSMHVHNGFSVEDTATVIQSHIIAMYLPSLVSGHLVARFGYYNIMIAGTFAMLSCISIALWNVSFLHYWGALVLLGIGWNFLFISGTTALAYAHRDSEKYTAQAINDGSVFGFQALAALSAGAILHAFDWQTIQWLCVPFLLTLLLWLVYQKKVTPLPSEVLAD